MSSHCTLVRILSISFDFNMAVLKIFIDTFTVAYKEDDATPNDIKLIGIFDELPSNGDTLEIVVHYGISINSPVHPKVIPRFSTIAELTARMSQVMTDFTGVETTLTAIYKPATDDYYGSYLFGIELKKAFEHEVSFSSSVSLGDFSAISVEDSSLTLAGSFMLSTEFGVILGADDTKGLKIINQVDKDTSCSSSNKYLDFNIILYRDNDAPVIHEISVNQCVEDVAGRVEMVKNRVNAVVSEEDVTVSLVGVSSLVLAFNPYWSKVELYAFEENIYGITNVTEKKTGFSFAIGKSTLEADLGVSGEATVSAVVLDTIEVAASIDASIEGSLQFDSGTAGKLVPFDTWLSNVRTILLRDDEFHDPDFATATISMDGSFGASIDVREPFALDLPLSVDGSFIEPFELDLLNDSAVQSPYVQFDIDLPNIGDIKKLSFGEIVKLLQQALEFLVGDSESGDTVESCSGGLLGYPVFTYKIPILGFSTCEFIGDLKIVVDAVDQLVNDCNECEDPDATKSTFNMLETKLKALLQDTVGGTPNVTFTPSSDDIRSSLDLDIELTWSFLEARQLNIDLAGIFEGMDLDEDFQNFAKGIIGFEGSGGTDLSGSLTLHLGVGLEYTKKTETVVPYIRGVTGITAKFAADANARIEATIGPLSAIVDVAAFIDNYGEPLSISVGLDPKVNYYISMDRILSRNGFKRINNMTHLLNEITVAIRGQIQAEIEIEFLGGLGGAFIGLEISDINNAIHQKPGAVSLYYNVTIVDKPTFIDMLLVDPVAIVNAVDRLFKAVNDLTLGRKGIVTNFPMPFIGNAIGRSMGAGSADNFLEKARRTVKGTLDEILNTYDVDDGDSTVADLIANVLTDVLGNNLGILKEDVSVTYFEHNGRESLTEYDSYNQDLDIKSLMWEIPFGQEYQIELPDLDFDLGNENFPLQISMGSDESPTIMLEWSYKFAFGFDEEDGFFLYTFPNQESELFIRADFSLPVSYIDAKLLYFLNLGLENLEVVFGAGIFVDVDKEHGMQRADDPNSVQYGRLSVDDIVNRVPVLKDLFVICAAGKLLIGYIYNQVQCRSLVSVNMNYVHSW